MRVLTGRLRIPAILFSGMILGLGACTRDPEPRKSASGDPNAGGTESSTSSASADGTRDPSNSPTIDLLALAQQIMPIVTVQNHYNLGIRQSEYMSVTESEEMIDLCARQGIGFIPWSPLAFGELARSGGALDQIAQRHNAKPGQVALA